MVEPLQVLLSSDAGVAEIDIAIMRFVLRPDRHRSGIDFLDDAHAPTFKFRTRYADGNVGCTGARTADCATRSEEAFASAVPEGDAAEHVLVAAPFAVKHRQDGRVYQAMLIL